MPDEAWDAPRRAALLAQVSLFAGIPPPAIDDLATRFKPRAVARAGFIFLEGAPAGTLHLVADGRVKIVRETTGGKQVILRLIHPGEPFGLSGIWGGATYPATAQALDRVVLLQLPVRELRELLAAHPSIALALIDELASRLREAEGRILDLQTEGVESRIARTLLRLASASSSAEPVSLAISRQDLADLCGTTLTTASRTLSAWHRQGFVLALRERVVIADRPSLEGISRA